MELADMLKAVGQIEEGILSRFCIAPKYEPLKACQPNFATVGPLSTVQNLQNVLWYCEQIKARAKDMRAQDWPHKAPHMRLWFGFACGLAAAEGMLPNDRELIDLFDACVSLLA